MKVLITLVFVGLFFTACGYTPPGTVRALRYLSAEVEAEREGFFLYVTAGSVTPMGLRLSMVNNTDSEVTHGTPFQIRKYNDGEWEAVPFIRDGIRWRRPLLIIAPRTTRDENISWEHMHGELPPGRYSIVREFNIGRRFAIFYVVEDWETACAYARFESLDVEILEHSVTSISFSKRQTNANNLSN
ncbi:MAG: hypothetical protein FWB80_15085 [Defluviitaleaceae bacterium]|nr:hypothetical protein [Defluviitaleaceae bacterium]